MLYSLGAVGVGIVYTVAVNTAVKWFPDRAGLTTGLGTMAFAAGSVLAVPYVRANATIESYPAVLRNVGLVILVVLLAGSAVLRDPPEEWLDTDDGDSGVAASLRGAATPESPSSRSSHSSGGSRRTTLPARRITRMTRPTFRRTAG